MRNGLCTGLVRVIDKVSLSIKTRVFSDDLHAVFICADGAVGAETVEDGFGHPVRFYREARIADQTQAAHVVVDAHSETMAWFQFLQLIKDCFRHTGVEVLRRQAIPASNNARIHWQRTSGSGASERGDPIQIQGLAGRAGFLGPVKHGNGLDRSRMLSEKSVHREWPI